MFRLADTCRVLFLTRNAPNVRRAVVPIQLMVCMGSRSSPSPSSRSYARFWLPLNMSLTLMPAFDCRCVWLNAWLAPSVCICDLRLSACMDLLLTSSACRTSLPIVSFLPNTGVPPANDRSSRYARRITVAAGRGRGFNAVKNLETRVGHSKTAVPNALRNQNVKRKKNLSGCYGHF